MGKRMLLTKKERKMLALEVSKAIVNIQSNKKLHWRKRKKMVAMLVFWYQNVIGMHIFTETLKQIARH